MGETADHIMEGDLAYTGLKVEHGNGCEKRKEESEGRACDRTRRATQY